MKNVEIPQFLIEMSKQLNEQNNRLTADPMFEVRYKQSLVTESGYNESHWEIIHEEGDTLYHSGKSESYDELAQHLFDYENEWCYSFLDDKGERFIDDDATYTESEFVDFFNKEFDHEWDDLPSEYKKLHMQEVEVTVNSHFTEKDAQAFINRKQHDYPKLYIYATSLCYCWNMIELRNWIKGLSGEQST